MDSRGWALTISYTPSTPKNKLNFLTCPSGEKERDGKLPEVNIQMTEPTGVGDDRWFLSP